jgi:hypothetical protein
MDWAAANGAYLPTDPAANFSPNAGGEPLGRICQNGQKTIEQLRQQMGDLCRSLVALEEPPSSNDVRAFAEQARLAAHLFLDDDIPDSLRGPAAGIDEWAEALPAATMALEGLRQRHVAVAAGLAAAGKVAESRRTLIKEMSAFESLVTARPLADHVKAVAQLPDLAKMQAAQATFRAALVEAEKRLAAARERLAALNAPDPRTNQSRSELLEQVLEVETARAAAAVQDAREKVESAVTTIEPTLERARDELATFERVIAWREFAGLSATALDLVDRVVAWGSAGVQAYFVVNEAGEFGPFEFEQRLDLGQNALAVRNTGRTSIDVYDIGSGSKVARGENGEAVVKLPGGEPGISYATTFRMTARCDDLWVQIEYLTRQIGGLLARLSKPPSAPGAASWARAFNEVLSSASAMAQVVGQTRRDTLERDNLVSDLKQLARFKERLTTQFLLERQYEMVPRFRQRLADAQAALKDANAQIARIFGKSQRDVETGAPMIPPRLAGEYENQTRRRDAAQEEIERMHRRFAKAVSQIKPRLTTPTLYGSDTIPSPIVLPGLGDDLLARVELLSEPAIGALVTGLEQQLATVLRAVAPVATPEGYREPAGSGLMARGLEAGAGQDTLTGLVGEGGPDDSMYGRGGAAGAAAAAVAGSEQPAGTDAEHEETLAAVVVEDEAVSADPTAAPQDETAMAGDAEVAEAEEVWVDLDAGRSPGETR